MQGDIAAGSIIDIKFNTVTATGAPITLAGSAAVVCYKDNSLTQSSAGLTLSIDFDSITGLHNVRVDTSADGTFYAAGSNFQVAISIGTVNSINVAGYVVGEFSIAARSALRPTTAGRTLDVNAAGEAGLDFDNTSGTLAKGTDLTGFNDLAAADVRTAVGLASANLDTQLTAIDDLIDTEIGSIIASLAALPTANANADALLDRAAGVETGMTIRQAMRVVVAALAGKASGLDPDTLTPTFRDTNDTVNRISAVTDEFGNRTSVTLNTA